MLLHCAVSQISMIYRKRDNSELEQVCEEPNDPTCCEVELNIQSNVKNVKRSVTLQWYMLLPNHTIANHRDGTLSHSSTFDITEDTTKVDHWFMYSK